MIRHYVLTGGSTGIGYALGKSLKDAGHRLTVIGRSQPDWFSPEQDKFFQVDLGDRQQSARCFKSLSKEIDEIDGVISNAGQGCFGQLENMSEQMIYESVELNLTSHILLSRALVAKMKRRGTGTLVFLGSEAALQGAKNGALYCAAKFGLRGFVQSLRADLAGSGVSACIVHPGMVDTAFFDDLWFKPGGEIGQHLRAEDVARTICHILDAPEGTVIDEVRISPQTQVIAFQRERRNGR